LGTSAVPLLCPLLKNEDVRIRMATWDAIEAIREQDGLEAVRPLLPCAVECLEFGDGVSFISWFGSDADPYIPSILATWGVNNRAFPDEALVRIGTPAVIAALVPLLDHEDREVRQVGATTLGKLGPKAAAHAPALVRLLGSARYQDCKLAGEALSQVGVPVDSLPALIERLNREPAETEGINEYNSCRGAVLTAISSMGDRAKAAEPSLTSILDDQLVGCMAASTLANLGNAALPSMPRVVELMWSSSTWCRPSFASVLVAIGTPAIPDLERMAQDPSDKLSAPAVEALEHIRQNSQAPKKASAESNRKTKKKR
jgi:HEAT repeat protein